MKAKLNLMAGSAGDEGVNSEINVIPLVDVMLVMLIIFMITIPVVVKSVPLTLPVANNIQTETTPENITLAIDTNGNFYWNDEYIATSEELFERLAEVAVIVPQPEVHIRADKDVRFEFVGRVMYNLQRASIIKVGFITNPELR
nr:MAG: biopolymer transporter ExbD [Hyphomicrobiales bacterium]